ncbi:WD repeat-containing protein 73 [Manis javanica]|nr:WD repeat-containing protein 73 [Manis javanica]
MAELSGPQAQKIQAPLSFPEPSPTLLKLSMAPGFRTCSSILTTSVEIHSSGSKAPALRAGKPVTAEAWFVGIRPVW